MNLKPRILELVNLGLGTIWQGAGLAGPARRAPPAGGAADGQPPLPPTSDFVSIHCCVVCLGLWDCGFMVLWRRRFVG